MTIRAYGFSILALATSAVFSVGCASAAGDDANANSEDGADEGALTASAAALVGSYTGEGASHSPGFLTLNLHADRTFDATIDTGVRCVRAPCPGSVQPLIGKFTAGAKRLTLSLTQGNGEGAATVDMLGRYNLARTSTGFTLTRIGADPMWTGWSEEFTKVVDGILPDDATKIVAQSMGSGFGPPAPAGSKCQRAQAKYTLDLKTKALRWTVCNATGTGPWAFENGSSTLSATEVKTITDATEAVTPFTGDVCGADKPLVSLSVTSPHGTKEYLDSFYACQGAGTYVSNIDGVMSAMRDAAN